MKAAFGEGVPTLSPLQRAYLIGGRPDFDLHVYPHLYLEVDLDAIDATALEAAAKELIHRNALLRSYVSAAGEIVLPEADSEFRIECQHFPDHPRAQQESILAAARERLSRHQFAPDQQPRIRIELSVFPSFTRTHISLDLMLFDGASVRLLLGELSRLYAGQQLPEKSQSIHCSLKGISDSTVHRQRCRDYWMKRLETLPEPPMLPLRAHNGEPRRSELVRYRHVLSPVQWSCLSRLCERAGVSPTTLLLAAYSRVVAAYSRNPHLYLTMLRQGAADDQRYPAAQNQASTLLVEVDYRSNRTFKEQLQQLHSRLMRDMSRSAVCGLEVLSEMNRQNSSTARAASPVAFVAMLEEPRMGGQDLFQLEGPKMVFSCLETPQVVLDHQAIRRHDGGVALVWDVMESAFEPDVVEAMFSAYIRLLDALAQDSGEWSFKDFEVRPLSQIRRHAKYNDTAGPAPECLLQSFLERKAASAPDKTAIVDGETTISYGVASSLSNRLAWVLRERFKVSSGQRVAVDLPRGWRQVVAVQAILLAGGVYVPMGHHQPFARKESIIRQCRPVLALTANDDQTYPCPTYSMADPQRWPDKDSSLPQLQNPEDTAYIIFTSGSTGTPKGVVIDHRGPANTIKDINRRFSVSEQDVVLSLSELNFDLSVFDIFGTFAAGGTVCISPEGVSSDPEKVESLIRQYGVTVWNSVPALAQLLLEYLERKPVSRALPLRLMMLSGDWLPVELPRRMSAFSSARVVSLGGATEASIWSIYYEILQTDPGWKSIPYGFPLTNQRVHVLDPCLQARPDNVPGELYISGIGLALGYWEAHEKNLQAFVRHPKTGERLYRTGDWGVRRPEGHVEFLGRDDGQVKIRGFRIELGEIESQLQRCPTVENAVVKVIGQSTADAALAAFVVSDEESFDPSILTSTLASNLPEYMVPQHMVRIDELPLSANGKVDRKALHFKRQGSAADKSGEAPRGAMERQLAEIWRDLLGLPGVSRDDNFFAIGGTSFIAVRMLGAVEQNFGVTLPMQSLIRHQELAALAKNLEQLAGGASHSAQSAVVPLTSRTQHSIPMAWFHPSGGNILCYREIAADLSAAYHGIGIQADLNAQPTSVEDLTRHYLDELETAVGDGPCSLAGWSFGGVVAYHAACVRAAQGKPVDSLIMIDAPAPIRSDVPADNTLIRWFLSDLIQQPDLTLPDTDTCGDTANNLMLAVKHLQDQGQLPTDDSMHFRKLFNQFRHHILALAQYTPPKLSTTPVPSLVFEARTALQGRVSDRSSEYWQERLGGDARVFSVAANHYSIMQPPQLNQLTTAIRRACPRFLNHRRKETVS